MGMGPMCKWWWGFSTQFNLINLITGLGESATSGWAAPVYDREGRARGESSGARNTQVQSVLYYYVLYMFVKFHDVC